MRKLFMLSVLLVAAMSVFALKKDPAYREARRSGALARMQLHIVNDSGDSVPDADVSVFMGMNFRPKGYNLKGVTDTNGIFVAEGNTCGDEIVIDVVKHGYYSSHKRLSFAKMGSERKVKDGRWMPFGEIQKMPLRRIVNPINLISFDKLIDVAHTNVWLGFDMAKMDFVSPAGKGLESDFEILVTWDGLPAWASKDCNAAIRFSNDKTGGYYVNDISESAFPYAYAANEASLYQEKQVRIIDRAGDPHTTRIPFAPDSSLVTRTRVVLDEDGKIKTANYGCIRHFDIGPSRRGVALLRLSYIFNPTSNDTNLEAK